MWNRQFWIGSFHGRLLRGKFYCKIVLTCGPLTSLKRIHTRAKAYESALRTAIARYTEAGGTNTSDSQMEVVSFIEDFVLRDSDHIPREFDTFGGKSKEYIASMLSASISAMSAPLPSLDTPAHINPLRHVTMHISRSDASTGNDYLTTFAPPLGITPLLSFSQIFSVQARLVNAACLRMFFKEHNLREHFSLLHRFLLLGDSVFTNRVSHALFSNDFDTTERQDGKYRSGDCMGLRVGSRDSWPPASSELRLALAGLLHEAYYGSKSHAHQASVATRDASLPGNLSFAIRELSPEEYTTVMDPDSLTALDFLKINYTPPKPLDAIISPEGPNAGAMYKYDRLFQLLLRLIRMKFVVDQLWRDATSRVSHFRSANVRRDRRDMVAIKFRSYARHFVTCYAWYVFEIAIGTTWRGFESRLDAIEAILDATTSSPSLTATSTSTSSHGGGMRMGGGLGLGGEFSLTRLHQIHGKVLDRILFCALLRRRQRPVMVLLEGIFGHILQFAKYSRERAEGTRGRDDEEDRTIEEMYYRFRNRVKTFVDVVKGLSEKRGYGDGRVPQMGEDGGGGGARVGVGVGVGAGAGAGAGVGMGGTGVGGGESAVFGVLVLRLEMNDCWR